MPEDRKTEKFLPRLLNRWLPPLIWVYFTFLFCWLGGYMIFGNHFAPLAAITQLAALFFLPLPMAVLVAFWLRNRGVWVGISVAGAAFLFLWGGLFVPRSGGEDGAEERLRVMSYNTLGSQMDPAPVLALIRQEGADVVLIQELNPIVAEALADELGDIYPYQVMDARIGVEGSGTISKYPLVDSGMVLPLRWVGTPQVLILSWTDEEVVLLNFHMVAVGFAPREDLERIYGFQREQAAALAELASEETRPLVVVGDANNTDLSTPYQIFTAGLVDSWREAGFGFGHTFPSPAWQRTAGFRERGLPSPSWMARIDFVLHSPQWAAVDANLAFDGVSDHRAVVVDLVLNEAP